MNWLNDMFNKNIEKTAEQTDAATEFQKKAARSPWLGDVLELDEAIIRKEAEDKIAIDIKIRDEVVKEAAYEAFQDTEEVLKQDMKRDVSILSDFTLASMIAEMRGHKKQDFMENATEYFEKAKRDVAADRKAVEKELLEGTGLSAQLDTFKAFADYKKDETPKQATEKELYQPQLKDVNDDLSKGGKVDAYAETDEQHAKTMLGVGREESERTDVTTQPGEVHKDAALVRDPDVELKVGSIIRLARSIMSHEGIILNEGTTWEIGAIDGFHYTLNANGQKHVISSHDTPKFNKLAAQKEAESKYNYTCNCGRDNPADVKNCKYCGAPNKNISQKDASQEITNHATKEQVLSKIAEISSPWAVVVDKDGKEVLARVSDEQVVKQSEEDKKDLSK